MTRTLRAVALLTVSAMVVGLGAPEAPSAAMTVHQAAALQCGYGDQSACDYVQDLYRAERTAAERAARGWW